METLELNLITIHGDVIEISIPDESAEEVLEDFREAQQKSDYWNVGNWLDVHAKFKGIRLTDINMNLIIGMQ